MQPRFSDWPPFVHDGVEYYLSHLNGVSLNATDSAGRSRRIRVTFSDHCFTRPPLGDDDPAPAYPDCSRTDGRFCTERHELSLGILAVLEYVTTRGIVWNSQSEHYVIIKNVDFRGEAVDYAIIFSISKFKGSSDYDLHMHVRTAHRRDEKPIDTFGSVRFAHLLTLAIQRKRPKKNYDRNRKRP
jgi:hypothetical protein